MYSRNHTKEDYELFKQWWALWNWDAIPSAFLPQNSVVVCNDDGEPLAAVFIYKTDTPICWIENYISSKFKNNREDVILFLISEAKKKAKEMGFKVAMSSVRHDGLANKLKQNSFIETDKGLTNYVGVL